MTKTSNFFLNAKLTKPVILIIQPTKPMLSIMGTAPLGNYIDTTKVPKGMEMRRNTLWNGGVNSGVFFRDKDVITMRVYYQLPEYSDTMRDDLFGSIREVMERYHVNARWSSHRLNSNDITFVDSQKLEKKCGAVMNYPSQGRASAILTLKFNADKVKGVYKLDNPKFKARGNVNHITEVVGGLNEANPAITPAVFDEIAKVLCRKLYWDAVTVKSIEELQ